MNDTFTVAFQLPFANAKEDAKAPFPQEDELNAKTARLVELNSLLDMDKRDNEMVEGEISEEDAERGQQRKLKSHERCRVPHAAVGILLARKEI